MTNSWFGEQFGCRVAVYARMPSGTKELVDNASQLEKNSFDAFFSVAVHDAVSTYAQAVKSCECVGKLFAITSIPF
jgi:hypothetical protein